MKQPVFELPTVTDRLVVSDYTWATVIRNGEVVGFTESMHNGRAAHATAEADGITRGIAGRPPQNEEGTLEVCRILVHVLNSSGGAWGSPCEPSPSIKYVDAVCESTSGERLLMQVVRARTSTSHWHALSNEGRLEGQDPIVVLTDELRASVRHKESIPEDARGDIVLVVSAIDSPDLALDGVARAFVARFGEEIGNLGFKAVWLVGPDLRMSHPVA